MHFCALGSVCSLKACMSDKAVGRHMRDGVFVCVCEHVSVCVVAVRWMSNEVCVSFVYLVRVL